MDFSQLTAAQTRTHNRMVFDQDALEASILRGEARKERRRAGLARVTAWANAARLRIGEYRVTRFAVAR